MFQLNYLTISSILICIAYLPLFIFIILNAKNKIAKVYSLHILSVAIWGIGGLVWSLSINYDLSNFAWKIAAFGIYFIPVFYQHTVLLITKKDYYLYKLFIYTQAIFFFTLVVIEKIHLANHLSAIGVYVGTPNIYYITSILTWGLISSLAHIQLITYYIKCYPNEKTQILALLFSIIGFLGGSANFLPSFGIGNYYGNFLVPVHSLIVTYAILKHQFLDIKIVIHRSIVYSLSIIAISLIYILSIVTIEYFLQKQFHYESIAVKITVAFILGLVFFPLRSKIQHYTDNLFFKINPIEMSLQNEKLRQEILDTEKYKTLSTLSSGIAHEIKNPLTAIKTFTEHLPQKLNDKAFLNKFSRIVGKEVERMDDLVHQLLDYAKPGQLAKKETNIHKLIKETVDIFNSTIIKQNINVVSDFRANVSQTINIDPNQFRQALMNVVLNAIEAMPKGGTLTLHTIQTSGIFLLTIKDTGGGIAREHLNHIFDPFFTKKDSGTGLGLSITQTIINNHNGMLRVNSEVEKGTDVLIALPIEQDKA